MIKDKLLRHAYPGTAESDVKDLEKILGFRGDRFTRRNDRKPMFSTVGRRVVTAVAMLVAFAGVSQIPAAGEMLSALTPHHSDKNTSSTKTPDQKKPVKVVAEPTKLPGEPIPTVSTSPTRRVIVTISPSALKPVAEHSSLPPEPTSSATTTPSVEPSPSQTTNPEPTPSETSTAPVLPLPSSTTPASSSPASTTS